MVEQTFEVLVILDATALIVSSLKCYMRWILLKPIPPYSILMISHNNWNIVCHTHIKHVSYKTCYDVTGSIGDLGHLQAQW